MKRRSIAIGSSLMLTALVGCAPSQTSPQADTPQEVTAISLTQTGCQFLEVESKDFEFETQSKADCEQINAETLAAREADFKPMKLKPGKYVFRVTNRDVPYELGFYLRGKGANQLTLPKVSGGGLTEGATKEYEVVLKPGEYLFSCPLNPTPDYPIVVQ